jgi:hypothetical protein
MDDARERELREKGAALARKLEEFARDDGAGRDELGQVLLGAYGYLEQRVGTLKDPPKPFSRSKRPPTSS